jgi:hypothetical protein
MKPLSHSLDICLVPLRYPAAPMALEVICSSTIIVVVRLLTIFLIFAVTSISDLIFILSVFRIII